MSTPEISFMQPFCCYCKGFDHNFRENEEDVNSIVLCPVLNNTQCKRCNKKGHTTTRCPLTYDDEEICKYCHQLGHIKRNCPVLFTKQCTYCGEKYHVASSCFKLKQLKHMEVAK
jgi:hypothetical protein